MVVRMVLGAIGVLVGAAAVMLTVLVAGIRFRVPPVVDALRRFNRAVTNPRVMRTAGTAQTQTSVIEHTGRTSGRIFQTPIDIVKTETGFLIALPYGTGADWLRNVLAAGSATLIDNGRRIAVDRPVVVATADVAEQIPGGTLRTLRLLGVRECLRLERA